MGAEPVAFTLALSLPAPDEAWLQSFSEGMFSLSNICHCELIGGDTTRGPLNICITIFGRIPLGQALRRDRAEHGDDIWVLNALRTSIAAVGNDIAELKNALNSIMETVAITCYINPAGGIKTEEGVKDVAVELGKIKLQEKETQPYEANTEE